MPGIRSQKLKIEQLAAESNFARIESTIRAEPLVARAKGVASTLVLSKILFGRMRHSITARPAGPYKAMAVSFAVSSLLPFLLLRTRQKHSHHK